MSANIYDFSKPEGLSSVDIDGECDCSLPSIFCPVCKHSNGNPYFEFPTLQISEALRRRFPPDLRLPPARFAELKRLIQADVQRPVNLVPGAEVGKFTGTVRGKLGEIGWIMPFRPLLAGRVVDTLNKAGLGLRAGTADLRTRKGVINDYFTIEPEPAELLSDSTLKEFTFERCASCGGYWQFEIRARPSGKLNLRADRWPSGCHIVRLVEHGGYLLVSEEFKARFLEAGLLGASFTHVGDLI